MSDAKPFASLGATLLARKGGAKPAMRPQSTRATVTAHATAQNLEDLGWDDMGEDHPVADHSAEVLHLTPAPHNEEAEALTDTASPKPKVRSMHEELAARIEEEERKRKPKAQALPNVADEEPHDPEPTVVAAATRPQPVLTASRARAASPARENTKRPPLAANDISKRAAFTLRLDARRHLKLRLASTVRGRSAQQIVTEALDRFLKDIPEIEALAAQVRRD
ncbi:hypothetical protein [Tsuneonella sp. HG222]